MLWDVKKITMITIYEPNQRAKTGIIKSWLIMSKNIVSSWDLIYQLFRRDFLMAYKKSFIGMGWLFISPIMAIISWVFMNATGVLSPGDTGIPYPAYVLISSTLWGLFMSFYGGATQTLTAGSGFIMQVSFNHDVLLIKQGLQQSAAFLINFVITLIFLMFFGVFPHWMIICFPLLMLPLFMLGSAIGLISSVISVVAVDIQKALGFGMGLLMYITPIIYSSKVDNAFLQQVIKWNPLTYLVGGMRDAILFGYIEHIDRYLLSAAGAMLVFLFAWRLFYVSEEKVIEKMV